LRSELEAHHQGHLLDYWSELSGEEQRILYDDLRSIPYQEMNDIFRRSTGVDVAGTICGGATTNGSETVPSIDDKMEPISDELCASVTKTSEEELSRFRTTALQCVAEGSVGVLLLAGGQGTRLGVPYPKGMYKIGLPSDKTLYQVQVERVLRLEQMAKDLSGNKSSPRIMMYVMTSEHTMEPTVEFFKEHNYFGMNPQNLRFFEQRMIPCFQDDGKIILQTKSKVARAPDGNGGLYWALKNEGTLEHMRANGVKYLHVYCVDNILAKVADPVFMGYCIGKGAEAGNKVCQKAFPTEPVGVVCKVDGKYQVVEYSEISEATASLTKPEDGQLVYNAGNICNHFFTTDFLVKLCTHHDHQLTYHVAKKKIPAVSGEKVSGVKLEKFVFDVFQFAEQFVVWECLRSEEFSPLKNADDPSKKDTPTTARNALFDLHRKYLSASGANVLDSVQQVEISPLISYAGENLRNYVEGKTFKYAAVVVDKS